LFNNGPLLNNQKKDVSDFPDCHCAHTSLGPDRLRRTSSYPCCFPRTWHRIPEKMPRCSLSPCTES